MNQLNQVLVFIFGLFCLCSMAWAGNIGRAEEKLKQGIGFHSYLFDLAPANSEQLEKFKKEGGNEHQSNHYSGKGEKNNQGYSDYHQYKKSNQGHDNKNEHTGHHGEEGGHKKSFHDAGGHHHDKHYVEKDEKGHKYGEKGGFKKGHSTKGTHEIHKLNEFKKNKEFFDEDFEEDNYEKQGGYHRHHGSAGGGYFKLGHHNSGYEEGRHGKKEHLGKAFHYLGQLGKDNHEGGKEYFSHGEKYGKDSGSGVHEIFNHGYGKFY